MKKQKVINIVLLILIAVLLIAIISGVVYLFRSTNTEEETNSNANTNAIAEINSNVNKTTNTVANKNANLNAIANANIVTNTNLNANANLNANLNINANRNTNVNLNTNSNSNANINTNSNLNKAVTITGWQTVTREKNHFSIQIPASWWWIQYDATSYGFAPDEATLDAGAPFPIEMHILAKGSNDIGTKYIGPKILTQTSSQTSILIIKDSSPYSDIFDKMGTTFSYLP